MWYLYKAEQPQHQPKDDRSYFLALMTIGMLICAVVTGSCLFYLVGRRTEIKHCEDQMEHVRANCRRLVDDARSGP